MRTLLILVPLIASAAFAGKCHRMTNEELSSIQEYNWKSTHQMLLVQSGVLCDGAIFYNFTVKGFHGCYSEIGDRATRILEGRTFSGRKEMTFDEFGLPEKTTTIERNRKTCEELYAEFKRKAR